MKIGIIIAMDKEMGGIMRIASEVERLTHSALYEVYRARFGDKILRRLRKVKPRTKSIANGGGKLGCALSVRFVRYR